jgi:hypothetical protein
VVKPEDDVSDTAENLIKVPLVDKHAQGALRRRVVHDQLERTWVEHSTGWFVIQAHALIHTSYADTSAVICSSPWETLIGRTLFIQGCEA